ncbi:hypothetical protein BLNAU_21574 [Blattamonas nauphoetae]|uniref:Transposase n=1 Tax=Blattamonas nauphoetae TaxID=2049346 RepID=A0ABQ9WVI7_9EUKA|nr:hypothetical protein BLNAU_21574 [Blattamonas nauphoetae]
MRDGWKDANERDSPQRQTDRSIFTFACALQVTPASEASCEREIARMRRTIGTTRYHTKPELLLAIHRIGLHKRLEKAQDKNDRRKEPDDSQVN